MSGTETTIRLNDEQRDSFEANGFLAIDRLLDEDDIRPLEEEYQRLLDETASRLHAEGKISSTYEEQEFEKRFSSILIDYPDLHNFFNISLPLTNGQIQTESYQQASPRHGPSQ